MSIELQSELPPQDPKIVLAEGSQIRLKAYQQRIRLAAEKAKSTSCAATDVDILRTLVDITNVLINTDTNGILKGLSESGIKINKAFLVNFDGQPTGYRFIVESPNKSTFLYSTNNNQLVFDTSLDRINPEKDIPYTNPHSIEDMLEYSRVRMKTSNQLGKTDPRIQQQYEEFLKKEGIRDICKQIPTPGPDGSPNTDSVMIDIPTEIQPQPYRPGLAEAALAVTGITFLTFLARKNRIARYGSAKK